MRIASRSVWIGVALIATGPIVMVTWRHWEPTRIKTALAMPMSLSPTVRSVRSAEFEINMDYLYVISVQMRRPFPRVLEACLAGPREELYNCNTNPIIKAQWRLWSDGRIVAQGSSDSIKPIPAHWVEYGAADDPLLMRTIGYFGGKPGRHYVVDVVFNGDLASLSGSDPKLVVEVPVTYDEEEETREFILFGVAALMGFFGLIMLCFSGIRSLARSYFMV